MSSQRLPTMDSTESSSYISEASYDKLSQENQIKASISNKGSVVERRKPFICFLETCQKAFSQYSSLQKHERIHRGEKPFVCQICGQAFTQNSNLKRHENIHKGEKLYNCTSCPKSFFSKSNLKQHEQIHDKALNRPKYDCDICDRSYYYLSSLKKHKNEHKLPEDRNSVDGGFSEETDDIERQWSDPHKKAKIDIHEEGDSKKTMQIELDIDQHTLRILPISFQRMLCNPYLMKEMQSIALEKGGARSNPVEAFERIRSGLSGLFNTVCEESMFYPYQETQNQYHFGTIASMSQNFMPYQRKPSDYFHDSFNFTNDFSVFQQQEHYFQTAEMF